MVEVGPGWGYLSMLAAQKYGADLTAYGLVGSQNDAMHGLLESRNFRGKLTERRGPTTPLEMLR